MYKVVLIDDNEIFLESLKKNGPWNETDCCLEGVAYDGISGKKMIEELRPDIIITDISMAEMDGLTMVEAIRKECPGSKILIITGYDKFEYAQKALQLKVNQILLKPVSLHDLQCALSAIGEEFKKEEERNNNFISLQKKLDLNKRNYEREQRKRMFQLLLTLPCCDQAWIDKQTEKHECYDGGYTIFVMPADQKSIIEKDSAVIESEMEKYRDIAPLIQIVSFVNSSYFITLVLYKKYMRKDKISYAEEKMRNILRDFGDQKEYLLSVTCADNHFYRMQDRYEKLILQLEERMYFLYETVAGDQLKFSESHIMTYFETVITNVKTIKYEDGVLALDKLVEEISQFYTPDLVLIRTALNGFSVLLVRAFDGMEYGETGAHGLMNGFNTVMNIKQAKEQLHAIYRECLKQRSGEDKKYSALVLAVLQYVRGNVYGDISLERTARYFNVSSGYLSGLVKKETGINYNQIVLQEKINAAKELLKHPEYSIEEIGEKIGYTNYISFYKAFKKATGMSPRECR